jgi:hypothetical protein
MKAKRGRAVLRRPNLGKAAGSPCQNFGLIGKSARFDLHAPAVPLAARQNFVLDFFCGSRKLSSKIPCITKSEFQHFWQLD